MRSDISQSIKNITDARFQTIGLGNEPKVSLVVTRKETLLNDFGFTERKKVRKTTKDSITDLGIAISHPKSGRDDEEAWVCYVKNQSLYVRKSRVNAELDEDWTLIEMEEVPTTHKCDIGFVSYKTTNRLGYDEYVTHRYPFVFYTFGVLGTACSIKYIDLETMEEHVFGGSTVSDLSVRQTPAGLMVFYLEGNDVKYRSYSDSEWSETSYVSFSGTVDSISSFEVPGGVGIQVYSSGKLYRSLGAYTTGWAWTQWAEVSDSAGTGALFELLGEKREAVFTYDHKLKYATANSSWAFTTTPKDLYSKEFSLMEFDHSNVGTVYFVMLYKDSHDGIYFYRYAYMRDVSYYVSNVEQVFITDNPISQINAEMGNIDDSLFTSDASLFAPSSMMKLGVSYGDSSIVPMGDAYIDQATIESGGQTVSISGRNRTGVFLADQTFEEDVDYTDTPSLVAEHIVDHFGLINYTHIDDSADLIDGNPNIISFQIKAKTSGMTALENLSKILSDDANNKQWKFEEMYDGQIIIGYDAFRNSYIPKNYYSFNGRSDVFTKTVDKCIDGVYNQVKVTGTTKEGKELSYIYPVKNFKYWDVGEKRTYFANTVNGTTKDELKKYGKALAKELKYMGRVITYTMNLKPQLLIGDVASVTYNEDPEQQGHITEIRHQLGENGYFTEFTVTSGGNIAQVSATPATRSSGSTETAYTADKSVNGNGRIKRLADYFGKGGGGGDINISQKIIQGDSMNFPEIIRNIGYRLLDEPKNVRIEYDEDNNEVKIKYTDPVDITSYEPVPTSWAGTIIVRNENGNPLHRWDGILINNSTTRDEYKNDWFVDDTNIQRGSIYYYGIFPYSLALDDADHPIYYYRYTKVVSVNTGLDLQPAIITDLAVDGVTVTLTFEIPTMRSGSYASITLVAKKDGVPMDDSDGDEIVSLSSSDTSAELSLDELSHYFFVIFSEDDQGNTAVSDPVDCMTEENPAPPPEYQFILETNNLYVNDENWLQDDTVTVVGLGGYWCTFPQGRRTVTLLSDTFETSSAHTTGALTRYSVYCANSVMTIRLTTQSGGTVSAQYSSHTMMANPKDYVTNTMWDSRTIAFPLTFSWQSTVYLGIPEQEPYTPSVAYEQSSFDDLSTALHYIYQHYANINLYVNGHKWVSVD